VAPGLQTLRCEARAFKSNAFAQATKKSYKSHLMTYLRFCFFYDLVPIPASQETLACYVAHLARTLKPVSVNIYLNIIRLMHVEAGFPNPLFENYELAMIKRGLLRARGEPPVQKAPLTVEILISLHKTVDFSLCSDRAFWCAMLIGFFGFLRKSSLIPASASVPLNKRLNRADVSDLKLDSFSLVCSHSKTNQFGQRTHVIPYAACADKRLCPVYTLLSHLGASPLQAHAPLFNFCVRGREVFYSHAAFVERLKAGVKRCGLDPSTISCHSLRRGGATLSFQCGLSSEHIKMRGDWRSECYQKYVVISPESSLEVARTLSLAASGMSAKL
jgi:integrase